MLQIDSNSTRGHHFFQVTQAQRIGYTPVSANHHRIDWLVQAFEHTRYS
jgi:hypothetical protein